MDTVPLDLVVVPATSAPVRVRLTRRLTTIGADASADVRIGDVPARWAIIDQQGGAVTVRLLESQTTTRLEPGQQLVRDRVTLTLLHRHAGAGDGLPFDHIVEGLSSVEGANDALRVLLRGLIDAVGADIGVIVAAEHGSHTLVAAEDREGTALSDVGEMLSDTIIADVLATQAPVCVPDAGGHPRYARVPSVIALRLRSVLCVPMAIGGRALGAVFLGRHDARATFTDRQVADLGLLAGMAVPLLIQLRRTTAEPSAPARDAILGESAAIQEVRKLIERIAPSDLSVLVSGETGTGKELVARAIHASSPRAGKPMVAITCSAVPEGLLGAELFGAARGAFTGAVATRKGKIEEADGSTLFLDEVGDMPLGMQAALLRVLEVRELTRLGENTPRQVDFRLVAATHKDLDAAVRAGTFREDLLFRIREVSVTLPPLRQRGEDVTLLATLFLRDAERQFGMPMRSISRDVAALIATHAWPGNVRELRAAMRRACLLSDGKEIRPSDLQLAPSAANSSPSNLGDLDRTLDDARDDFARRYVNAVLERNAGNREKAAVALGISLRSLYRFL